MGKAPKKLRLAAKRKTKIVSHNDAGRQSRKQLQRSLSKKLQRQHNIAKRKRKQKLLRHHRKQLEQKKEADKEEAAVDAEESVSGGNSSTVVSCVDKTSS